VPERAYPFGWFKSFGERGGNMWLKSGLVLAGALSLAMPMKGLAVPIVAYNFGPNSTSFTYAATTVAANVTASGINSTGDFGANDVFSADNGVGGTSGWYTNNPGGNYLSVESSGSTTDNGYWIETIVTAQAGYVIDPTSFELIGGAGGSSAVRSAYIYDNVDGLPTSLVTNGSGAPTITGGDLLASGTFTAVRGTSGPPSMNEIQVASFPASDVNLSSFIVRIYFDTEGNIDKNIDLGTIELDGSVVAAPEPAALFIGLVGLAGLWMRRQRS
jgi:MYXO-CTERM domain-containing protein